jgi:hypothetical protein
VKAMVSETDGDRLLWRLGDVECWMIACCAGAELRVSRADEMLVRELYPAKPDLYERAKALREEFTTAAADRLDSRSGAIDSPE